MPNLDNGIDKSNIFKNVIIFTLNITAGFVTGVILLQYKKLSSFGRINLFIYILFIIIILLLAFYAFSKRCPKFFGCVKVRGIQDYDEVKEQIRKTKKELWAFQISGGYHTYNLREEFKNWVLADKERKLYLLFINPQNTALVKSTGILTHRIPSQFPETQKAELEGYRSEILESLNEYYKIKTSNEENEKKILIRVYDSAPSASILGSDVRFNLRHTRIFVEHYVYSEPWEKRPCFILTQHEKKFFEIYEKSFWNLWKNSKEYVLGDI